MSRRNTGNFISATDQATDSNTANGIFTLTDAAQRTALGSFPTGRFTPSRSLRFRESASAYLSRTTGTPTNNNKWTYSTWVKRGKLGVNSAMFGNWKTASQATQFYFKTDDTLRFYVGSSSGVTHIDYISAASFRDCSAWYHVVLSYDNTLPTTSIALYVNGNILPCGTTTNIATQNGGYTWNQSALVHYLMVGKDTGGNSFGYFDGHVADTNFIDGQALTPTSFGLTDPETGTWVPQRYSGTYGNNGFYLNFNDNSAATAAAIGKDTGIIDGVHTVANNWTPTGISITAGYTYDSMVDVPGIASVSSATDVGAVQRGNYATLNSAGVFANAISTAAPAIVEGGLGSYYGTGASTIALPTSGKWYWEVRCGPHETHSNGYSSTAFPRLGVMNYENSGDTNPGLNIYSYWDVPPAAGNNLSYYNINGVSTSRTSGADAIFGPYITDGDMFTFAYDADTGKLWFGKNNTWWNSGVPATGVNPFGILPKGYTYAPFVQGSLYNDAAKINRVNFGQRPFTYTIPTGFKTLNTTNLPNPSIKRPTDHFDVKTWTGNGTALTVGNTAKQTTTTQIPKSLRFRGGAAAGSYLNRAVSSTTSLQKLTYSVWVKRGDLGRSQHFALSATTGSQRDSIRFNATDNLAIFLNDTVDANIISTNVFRDSSAWYHFVVAIDTTQSSPTNRIIVWVNNAQITSWSTASFPVQNYNFTAYNKSGLVHNIGRSPDGTFYYDGYMAELNYIDGQALTPTSFGQFDANNNWFPKPYTGTYGANGFYLNFNDNSAATAAAIGKDSGTIDAIHTTANNWTPTGISVTAGSTYDSMLDSPTDYDDGTNVHGNYAVLNSASAYPLGGNTVIDGNLNATMVVSAGYSASVSSFPLPATGKYYCEIKYLSGGLNACFIGVFADNYTGASAAPEIWGVTWNAAPATYICHATNTSSADTAITNAAGQTTVMAVDMTAGKMWIGSDRLNVGNAVTWVGGGNPSTGTSPTFTSFGGGGLYSDWPATARNYFFGVAGGYSGGQIVQANFGQRPFLFTIPTGFKTLNTKNLRDVSSYNLPDTYGNFVNNPDFVWIKNRNSTQSHETFDSLRGPSNYLPIGANGAAAVETVDANTLTEFSPNGFKLGSGSSLVNTSGNTYVAWCWNAGSSTVTNTDGSIPSTVRANPTAGFSIVSNYGTGANATVGHGLGAAPAMILRKARNLAYSWIVYHQNSSATPGTKGMYLDYYGGISTTATYYNSTPPNSSVFSLGSSVETNYSGYTYMAYCWTPIPGYSAFGSYIGNGAVDGPFIHCGFRPKYLLVKNVTTFTAGYNWFIYDTARDTYNPAIRELEADLAVTEDQYGTSTTGFDILSNGFKLRISGVSFNESGSTHIYAAFAETPFKYANAR